MKKMKIEEVVKYYSNHPENPCCIHVTEKILCYKFLKYLSDNLYQWIDERELIPFKFTPHLAKNLDTDICFFFCPNLTITILTVGMSKQFGIEMIELTD